MVKIKNIYQDRKTKKWFFRAYFGTDYDGRKIQKTKRGFSSQKEAKLAYDKFMLTYGYNQAMANKFNPLNQMTFEEFYRVRFVKWYEKKVKRQTFENAQFIFEKKLRFFYSLCVSDISSETVEDWMFELSQTATRNSRKHEFQDTLSTSYINRIKGHLKIVMNRAMEEGLIETNPVDNISDLPLENKKVDFWEINEFKKVMKAFSKNTIQSRHRKLVYEILFYTGIRIGELEALIWSNVNFEKKQITIEKTLVICVRITGIFQHLKLKMHIEQ